VKVALIGGGGVRSPIFVGFTLRRAERLGLDEICLMDVDEEKLRIFGTLSRAVAGLAGCGVRITATTDARQAIEDARYVITTIRAGGDEGRVLDERIALRHGVLGQETTGAGGFAMALRSVPAVLDCARLRDELSPEGWILNFTNPAGLVVQALRERGFDRVIGICDGANEAQHAVAEWLHLDPRELRAEVFGLNHLSWARRVLRDGEDVLSGLLDDDRFLAGTAQSVFAPELVRQTRMWINPYLYYWYYTDQAIAATEGQTRGEEILGLSRSLMTELRSIDLEGNPLQGLRAFTAYERARVATYMKEAHGEGDERDEPALERRDLAEELSGDPASLFPGHGEGYAGVALDLMEAMERDEQLYTAVNVANDGAITALRPGDVVEVSVVATRDSVSPLAIGTIPEQQELLMRTVKLYERTAVAAILERSRSRAAQALMLHPLVGTYPRAVALVRDYLEAHARHAGEWRD
jgi:6-phospho-beta-glucosidase